ncbi:hypothetical protein PR048_000338 [Dryococelus australis]|uniref:Uncharacterized protein n=1 Tax=Dryococelus australis TaxID=614101 RepID=A0ABQ9IGM4_9NEOP|nr:hypothetical protein PR048_000338 [Dryococelus australis]
MNPRNSLVSRHQTLAGSLLSSCETMIGPVLCHVFRIGSGFSTQCQVTRGPIAKRRVCGRNGGGASAVDAPCCVERRRRVTPLHGAHAQSLLASAASWASRSHAELSRLIPQNSDAMRCDEMKPIKVKQSPSQLVGVECVVRNFRIAAVGDRLRRRRRIRRLFSSHKVDLPWRSRFGTPPIWGAVNSGFESQLLAQLGENTAKAAVLFWSAPGFPGTMSQEVPPGDEQSVMTSGRCVGRRSSPRSFAKSRVPTSVLNSQNILAPAARLSGFSARGEGSGVMVPRPRRCQLSTGLPKEGEATGQRACRFGERGGSRLVTPHSAGQQPARLVWSSVGVQGQETGDPRENPPTSGIVRPDPHMRKSGGDPAGNRIRFAFLTGKLWFVVVCNKASRVRRERLESESAWLRADFLASCDAYVYCVVYIPGLRGDGVLATEWKSDSYRWPAFGGEEWQAGLPARVHGIPSNGEGICVEITGELAARRKKGTGPTSLATRLPDPAMLPFLCYVVGSSPGSCEEGLRMKGEGEKGVGIRNRGATTGIREWTELITRMDERNLTKEITHYNPRGKRDVGRPRRRWNEPQHKVSVTVDLSTTNNRYNSQFSEEEYVAARPRSRNEGAIRATLTRPPSASSLLRTSVFGSVLGSMLRPGAPAQCCHFPVRGTPFRFRQTSFLKGKGQMPPPPLPTKPQRPSTTHLPREGWWACVLCARRVHEGVGEVQRKGRGLTGPGIRSARQVAFPSLHREGPATPRTTPCPLGLSLRRSFAVSVRRETRQTQLGWPTCAFSGEFVSRLLTLAYSQSKHESRNSGSVRTLGLYLPSMAAYSRVHFLWIPYPKASIRPVFGNSLHNRSCYEPTSRQAGCDAVPLTQNKDLRHKEEAMLCPRHAGDTICPSDFCLYHLSIHYHHIASVQVSPVLPAQNVLDQINRSSTQPHSTPPPQHSRTLSYTHTHTRTPQSRTPHSPSVDSSSLFTNELTSTTYVIQGKTID